jgi:phage gp29-like protein
MVSTPSRILGPDGNPIRQATLDEPQTSTLTALYREFAGHPSRGLTPSRLARILDAAEQGDLIGQYELFEDMEEKDAHISSEMGKRRRALILDYDVVPPRNANAREKREASALEDYLAEINSFQDMLFDLTDSIGKGFTCLEYGGWQTVEGVRLPVSITFRPQTWFKFYRGVQQEIRLRDNSADGAPLNPFGWIVHTHKAKSGYLERSALFRVLAWPYLFKNYSVGDLAEFLEIYGIPLRLGKYPSGASEKEKGVLLRALASIGHRASGIIPEGMVIEMLDAVQGDPAAFDLMTSWCEKAVSKAVLGGTLTSQADGKSSTHALGNVHDEVRKDLRDSDARQIETTLTRDLVYPIAVLNGMAQGGLRRCPRLRLRTTETEDLTTFSTALQPLVALGMKIDRQWAQERVGIPEPDEGADLLAAPAAATPAPAGAEPVPADSAATAVAAASAQLSVSVANDPPAQMVARLDANLAPATAVWIEQIKQLVATADSLEAIRDGLDALLPDMTLDQYADAMAQALAAAALAGRYEILQEAANG